MSSEELVAWCQRTLPEDTRAFEYLVTQYRGRVYSTTYRIMGNPQEAEDQAQEVFLKIYKNIRNINEPQHYQPGLRVLRSTHAWMHWHSCWS